MFVMDGRCERFCEDVCHHVLCRDPRGREGTGREVLSVEVVTNIDMLGARRNSFGIRDS